MAQAMKKQFETIDKFQKHPLFQTLEKIPFTVAFDENTVSLTVWATDIMHSNMITIKSVFGPLEYEEGHGSKTAKGSFIIDSDTKCNVKVYGAMSCTDVEIADEGPSADQIARAIKGLQDGSLKLKDCNSFNNADPSEFCLNSLCFNKTYGTQYCSHHKEHDSSADEGW